jgi:hypothetical protein
VLAFFDELRRDRMSIGLLFFSTLVAGYVGYVFFKNFIFLVGKRDYETVLKVNQIFCILQLIHVSIFGMVVYFTAGPEITPAFFYSDQFLWQVRVHSFNIRLNVSYHQKDNDINAGINLVPLVYFILASYFTRNARGTEEQHAAEYRSHAQGGGTI